MIEEKRKPLKVSVSMYTDAVKKLSEAGYSASDIVDGFGAYYRRAAFLHEIEQTYAERKLIWRRMGIN